MSFVSAFTYQTAAGHKISRMDRRVHLTTKDGRLGMYPTKQEVRKWAREFVVELTAPFL